MATTTDYLNQLKTEKQTLVDNLNAIGIEATDDETFTTLIPKLSGISVGGGDLSEYFNATGVNGQSSANSTVGNWIQTIKKLVIKDAKPSSCQYYFAKFRGETIEFDNFDTSNVIMFRNMFDTAQYLTSLDLSFFNTSKATDMRYMFTYCSALTSLNVDNFVTENVINFQNMFYSCSKLTSLNINHFNVSKSTTLASMFGSCSLLTELDLSNWEIPLVINTGWMFQNCSKLTKIDIRKFDFSLVTTYTSMFQGVPSNCLIIVKDDTQKTWITEKFTNLTNVKTVAELEA